MKRTPQREAYNTLSYQGGHQLLIRKAGKEVYVCQHPVEKVTLKGAL